MSKKRKYFSDRKGKKGKKNNGKRRSSYNEPKFKTVRPSLDKSEVKANRKVVTSPVEVPKEFVKNRRKCNHGGKVMSVTEYKAMTPNWAAYTPALERAIATFGEEHVHICGSCYDVVVDRNSVSADSVFDALTTLYAACNVAVANRRLKEDEIKEINKLKESFDDFRPVIEILQKLEEVQDDSNSGGNGGGGGRGPSIGNPNVNPGSAFVQ